MFNAARRAALLFALASLLRAQTPLENNGKPMRVVYECTAADTQAAGLGCSEEDPCPVYLELANVEAVGRKIFVTGNLHTPMATLYSILLASEDGGNTWTEPHPRMRSVRSRPNSIHRFSKRLDLGRQPARRAARSVSL